MGLLGRRRATQAPDDLAALPLELAPHRPLLARIWALRENATARDAASIALAELLAVPFLSADARLQRVPDVRCPIEALAALG